MYLSLYNMEDLLHIQQSNKEEQGDEEYTPCWQFSTRRGTSNTTGPSRFLGSVRIENLLQQYYPVKSFKYFLVGAGRGMLIHTW